MPRDDFNTIFEYQKTRHLVKEVCIKDKRTMEVSVISSIKKIVGKHIGLVFRILGLQNVIIIEAEQGTRENTQAVFSEMLQRGWTEKYRFILVSDDPSSLAHWRSKQISVYRRVNYESGFITRMCLTYQKLRAVMIIDENLMIRKWGPDTCHIYLSHGSPVKSTHDFYNCTDDTDFSLCQSDFWRPIESYQLKIPEEKLVIKGFPRNDAIFSSRVSMVELFGKKFRKVVVWYPTFRQRKNRYCSQNTTSSAIPVIHDEVAARKVNEIAAKYGVLIVIKPHTMQDLSQIVTSALDHLKFIYDDFFIEHGLTAHEFLAQTDAMITDYSSIVFDYLLTGKPIALTWEDFEEYKERVGFAIDMNLLRSCSSLLYNPEDFDAFFRDLVEGNDPLRERREELMHLTNQYTDGNSTKRVVDWLETLLK